MASEVRPRFLADANVGKLARWLRLLGYDCAFVGALEDRELLVLARREARWVLTRDTRLVQRRWVRAGHVRALLVRAENPSDQLVEVINFLGIDDASGRFTRCLECNQELEELPRALAQPLVPPYVFATQPLFRRCPGCQRVYWRGTHWAHMVRCLEAIRATSTRTSLQLRGGADTPRATIP